MARPTHIWWRAWPNHS